MRRGRIQRRDAGSPSRKWHRCQIRRANRPAFPSRPSTSVFISWIIFAAFNYKSWTVKIKYLRTSWSQHSFSPTLTSLFIFLIRCIIQQWEFFIYNARLLFISVFSVISHFFHSCTLSTRSLLKVNCFWIDVSILASGNKEVQSGINLPADVKFFNLDTK